MIRFAFHRIDGAESFSTTYSIKRSSVNHAVLTGITTQNGIPKTYIKHYHTTVHQATQSVSQENETCNGQVSHTSDVALAFELSETSVPIIVPQDVVSAYSPVRSAGFPFIIHAYFVTESSQDIVKDSQRNFALLD